MWSKRFVRRSGGVAAAILLTLTACQPPLDDAIVNEDGEPILLEDITEIVDDPDLTEQQKRRQLQDLGITDDEIIDLLIREL